MADQGKTPLTAARARRLAEEIREEASATQVHAILRKVRLEASEGHYSMSYDFVSALTEETLKALGFSVSHSEGSIVWISW